MPPVPPRSPKLSAQVKQLQQPTPKAEGTPQGILLDFNKEEAKEPAVPKDEKKDELLRISAGQIAHHAKGVDEFVIDADDLVFEKEIAR